MIAIGSLDSTVKLLSKMGLLSFPLEDILIHFRKKNEATDNKSFVVDSILAPFNPFSAGTAFMLLQTGWIQANSAAGLRSNLFATQSIITHKK